MFRDFLNIQTKTQQSLSRMKEVIADVKESGMNTLEELGCQRQAIHHINNRFMGVFVFCIILYFWNVESLSCKLGSQ